MTDPHPNRPQVCHTVFFQFREDALPSEIEQFFAAMAELKTQHKVSGILSFSYGPHNSQEGLNQGFNYGMTLIFASPEDRDIYLPHPEHERVKAIVIPLLKNGLNSVIAVDWYLQGNNEF
jgi:hypothetical protein